MLGKCAAALNQHNVEALSLLDVSELFDCSASNILIFSVEWYYLREELNQAEIKAQMARALKEYASDLGVQVFGGPEMVISRPPIILPIGSSFFRITSPCDMCSNLVSSAKFPYALFLIEC